MNHQHLPLTEPVLVNLSAPRVAVLAVTFRGDELILVQRRNEPQEGGWGFPGGSIEPGKSIRDATMRELKEETGVSAEIGELLELIELREFDARGQHHHFLLVAMLCHYMSGELKPGDDASACRWIRMPDGLADFEGDLIEHVAAVGLRAWNRFPKDSLTKPVI